MSIFRKIIGNYLISSALLSSQKTLINKPFNTTISQSRPMSSTSSTDYSIAYVTAPNTEVAKDIAKKLVENRLSACVNIIPSVISIYEWKGKIETDSEVLMIIKTRTSRVEELTTFVKNNHPYEVCEVITVPIQYGNKAYLEWLANTIPQK